MKTRTKIQIEVDLYSKELLNLNDEQRSWARENVLNFFVYSTKKQNSCLECNHKWKNDSFKSKHVICPNCGRKLLKLEGRKRTNNVSKHFIIIETFKNYQIIRTFFIEKKVKLNIL